MQELGLKNILGIKNGASLQCLVSNSPGGAGTTYTVVFDQNGNWVSDTLPGLNYEAYARSVYDGSNPGSACPSIANEGTVYTQYGRIVGISQDGTGIYEFQPMYVALGSVAILCAIIAVGIRKAQQGVRNMTEETSEDDPLEWYEGPDGRQYWRVKRSIRRKMGYD
jgi:hypothetical protein